MASKHAITLIKGLGRIRLGGKTSIDCKKIDETVKGNTKDITRMIENSFSNFRF